MDVRGYFVTGMNLRRFSQGRSNVHESVLRALLQSELEMTENGLVVFWGKTEDGVSPEIGVE